MKKLSKALVICISGHTEKMLEEYGHLAGMKTVMLGDRLFDRADECRMIVLDGMTRSDPASRAANWEKHLKTAYEAGRSM